jgi:hypothetical protein
LTTTPRLASCAPPTVTGPTAAGDTAADAAAGATAATAASTAPVAASAVRGAKGAKRPNPSSVRIPLSSRGSPGRSEVT